MNIADINAKIDSIANSIKEAASDLDGEVTNIEEAGTSVYEAVSNMLESIQKISNTLLGAVQKGLKEDEQPGS